MTSHSNFMRQALKLAEIRRGFCAPNPSVGAVVVKNGVVISEGKHWACGHAHAEVDAIQSLSPEQMKDATIYVTLEPCCHRNKRTPPCTDLIIRSGIKEVYYAFKDPNPEVAGQGALLLQKEGIVCQQLELDEVTRFYQSYSYWWKHHKPWITAKLALSLDGKIALQSGIPTAISGEKCNQYTHEWRKKSDAILTTAKTILADDPQLNVRLNAEIIQKPVYILDRQLQVPLSARIFKTASKVVLFHDVDVEESKLLQNAHIQYVKINSLEGKLDLEAVLIHLGKEGVHDLWIEAGGTCVQSFMQQKLLHRLILYVAPKILGPEAYPAFSEHFTFDQGFLQWKSLGDDVALIWEVK